MAFARSDQIVSEGREAKRPPRDDLLAAAGASTA